MSIRTERDIVFAQARIGYNKGEGPMQVVSLKLDAYLPAFPGATPAPALVLAHGGAFHRGSKEDDRGAGRNTTTADYCRRFAALGWPSFSVQYRLAQTDPEPSRQPVLTRPDQVPMSRVDVVRAEMGLPPIGPSDMARVMEAAVDDVADAVRFVKTHHGDYGIDPGRIVLGGFSAGGRCAAYAAYGKHVGVAGVLSISAPLVPVDAAAYLASAGARPLPPLLMISGECDLDYVCAFVPEVERQFSAAGRQVEWACVPGGTHFYSSDSRTSDGRMVFEVIRASITRWVGQPADQFAQVRSAR
ncbi:Alpha/beta hydrolase family protein [Rhodospirillales bacterium URHD0017]|nr:Alpha/beta hydrolase family protein [Rhodospirillales bacterium URHD0017]